MDFILSNAPYLKNGIDVLYIDSLHAKNHVERELSGWYPFLKKGSHIFFDDVDSNPYRKGQRKDHFHGELRLDEIREYIEAFFIQMKMTCTWI